MRLTKNYETYLSLGQSPLIHSPGWKPWGKPLQKHFNFGPRKPNCKIMMTWCPWNRWTVTVLRHKALKIRNLRISYAGKRHAKSQKLGLESSLLTMLNINSPLSLFGNEFLPLDNADDDSSDQPTESKDDIVEAVPVAPSSHRTSKPGTSVFIAHNIMKKPQGCTPLNLSNLHSLKHWLKNLVVTLNKLQHHNASAELLTILWFWPLHGAYLTPGRDFPLFEDI